MKRILGLDLGPNSIGWAVTLANEIEKDGKITLQPYKIEAANSRIIPMDAAILGDFDNGNSVSQTANRTAFRGTRRLRERSLLRRERMHRVLDLMGFLPSFSISLAKVTAHPILFGPKSKPNILFIYRCFYLHKGRKVVRSQRRRGRMTLCQCVLVSLRLQSYVKKYLEKKLFYYDIFIFLQYIV